MDATAGRGWCRTATRGTLAKNASHVPRGTLGAQNDSGYESRCAFKLAQVRQKFLARTAGSVLTHELELTQPARDAPPLSSASRVARSGS
jgi:hypothetical protein